MAILIPVLSIPLIGNNFFLGKGAITKFCDSPFFMLLNHKIPPISVFLRIYSSSTTSIFGVCLPLFDKKSLIFVKKGGLSNVSDYPNKLRR